MFLASSSPAMKATGTIVIAHQDRSSAAPTKTNKHTPKKTNKISRDSPSGQGQTIRKPPTHGNAMPRIDKSTLSIVGEKQVLAQVASQEVSPSACSQQAVRAILHPVFCHHAFEVSSQLPPFLTQDTDSRNDLFPP